MGIGCRKVLMSLGALCLAWVGRQSWSILECRDSTGNLRYVENVQLMLGFQQESLTEQGVVVRYASKDSGIRKEARP